MRIVDYFIAKDNRLKPTESCILRYVFEKAQKRGSSYIDTCLAELQKITKHKCDASTSKIVSKLCNWGYIRKEYYKSPNAKWPHLRLYISIPKEFEETLKKHTKWLPKNLANILLSSSNEENNKQINHSKDKEVALGSQDASKAKPRNTTAQDMLNAYTEVTGEELQMTKRLASYLMKAKQQTFSSLEEWKKYLKYKIKGNIKKPMAFLLFLLDFQQLNAYTNHLEAMRDAERYKIEMTQKAETAYQECLKHIENCSEPEDCKKVRRLILDNKGAFAYNTWMTKVRLVVIDDDVEVEDDAGFASKWVRENYYWHWHYEMMEQRKNDRRRDTTEDRFKGKNQGNLFAL